ncbi:helix-turn-helix domain-containing protein [Pedobacter nototheniae]|uniref:helix-turn-helix domain-containing protein n=1 Tax=Pedobacter nototheniae TaxID=2488994 RepID=UPI00292F22F8|nr:helix-turn-helix domain-containing protein [Pedobacter nototheniae]
MYFIPSSRIKGFTNVPYSDLLNEADVFQCIFGNQTFMLEKLFERNDPLKRTNLIEAFLMKKLMTSYIDSRTQFVLDHIYQSKGNISVYELSCSLKINESTLYRSFKAALGQSPKDFIQTVWFRNAFKLLLDQDCIGLTELTYKAMFYDQSHFIRDFKMRSGILPNEFRKSTLFEQYLFAWLVDDR